MKDLSDKMKELSDSKKESRDKEIVNDGMSWVMERLVIERKNQMMERKIRVS